MSALPAELLASETADVRRAMVDSQLRTNEINDPALIAAIAATPREHHVPREQQSAAYIDRALPLGGGRALNPVLTTARLIGELGPVEGKAILLIGAATGYAAAILGRLGAKVTAVEESAELLAIARPALAGCDSVTLVEAPLASGHAGDAPYDALLVDGAIEQLPTVLLNQLADGAPIVSGLIDRGVARLARATHVSGADSIHPLPFIDLECVQLPGFAPPPRFSF